MVTPPPQPPLTPIEKIEFTRIQSEEKRKIAELELENKKIRTETAEAILGFETKIKEMELKYNTQLDTTKIKADADIEKLITTNRNKTFLAAQQAANQVGQQIGQLNGQRPTGQTPTGSEPGEQGETAIRKSPI